MARPPRLERDRLVLRPASRHAGRRRAGAARSTGSRLARSGVRRRPIAIAEDRCDERARPADHGRRQLSAARLAGRSRAAGDAWCRACACRRSGACREPWLEQAQDDATLLAIRDMERAGIDIITDGEIRRESYSNRFATALDGIDVDHPATIVGRAGRPVQVPRVVGRIRRRHPVEVRDVEFLRANTERTIKITLPGPFTLSQQAKNEFYADEEELAMDYAAAVNEEAHDLKRAGADVVQLDEPWVRDRARARRALRAEGDQPRARRHPGADRGASVLRLRRAGARTRAGRATPSWSSSPTARSSRSRSRRRSRSSISACCERSRARPSSSACSTSATPAVETAERGRRAHPRAGSRTCPPSG